MKERKQERKTERKQERKTERKQERKKERGKERKRERKKEGKQEGKKKRGKERKRERKKERKKEQEWPNFKLATKQGYLTGNERLLIIRPHIQPRRMKTSADLVMTKIEDGVMATCRNNKRKASRQNGSTLSK